MPANLNINQPTKGMNLDFHPINLDGTKTYYKALNAKQESVDGEQLALTNETGTIPCIDYSSKGVLIGTLNIPERNNTFYFFTDDIKQISEIGMSDTSLLEPCNYETILIAPQSCLGFTSKTPIHKIDYKLTNKTYEIYWTDATTSMKWIDLYNIPRLSNGDLDCNRIQIFPDFLIPCGVIEEVNDSGSLLSGSYQFFIAYANSKGEELSQYYIITDPAGIWENQITNRLDFPTSKAIKLDISNLDISYQYFNIAIGKNINLTESFVLAGTFEIEGSSNFEYLYTGNNKAERPLTTNDIFFRYPYYRKAETLAVQNNMLIFGGLEEDDIINHQPIVNNVVGYWEEWSIPENSFEGYSNAANTSNYRSYLRDECYALELAFVHKSGRISPGFHWPGPGVRQGDRELISNQDANNTVSNPCDDPPSLEKWKVYNTAQVIGYSDDYLATGDKSCYKGPYRYGLFSSWESDLTYPNNRDIWGDLAGQNIRHWKFPDCAISPIHDNANLIPNYQHTIYPLGIRIDLDSLKDAIRTSSLTEAQKNDIVGVKVLRGNRSTHKTIIGKGLLYNVGKYTRDGEDYLYPNYPYNDLNPDVFIASQQVDQKSGSNVNLRLNGFEDENISKVRYTLHSPDTSFVRPPITGSFLKLETAEFGKAKAHIVQVIDNAKYAMGTKQGIRAALAIGLVSILGFTAGFAQATVQINLQNFLPTYNAMVDLLKKLIPYRQYGYQYNSVGNYTESIAIPDNGNKIRRIITAKYLDPGIMAVEGDIAPINNYQRESSVYLRTNETLPYPHEIQGVPQDNSRFTKNSDTTSLPIATNSDLETYWNNLTPDSRQANFGNIIFDNVEDQRYIQLFSYDWVEMQTQANILEPELGDVLVDTVRTYYEDNILPSTSSNTSSGSLQRIVDISSYYASIKRNVPDQYGQIYSYQTIDTGYCLTINLDNNSDKASTIFGGDTFINRFGLKRKMPFFLTNTVGLPDDTDIFYDQIGNVGYPIYYLSTGPKEYTPSQNLMNKLDRAYSAVTATDFGSGLKAAITAGLTRFMPGMSALVALVQEIVNRIGVKNNNLDDYQYKGFWEEGMMYLFIYGIPYFFVESDVNVDYRQAENSLERNFYPNVGSDVPDIWLQEKNVSINFDNYYYYNKSLSHQNLENSFTHLPLDFNPARDTKVVRPTRVIYSQPSNLEEKQNNWLIFKANNYYDFPLTSGKLIDLNAIESEKVLARFENNASLYNAYITLDTSNKTAITGTGSMFANPPIEFSKTEIGYTGTQHKTFRSTKYGHFWVDAKRGNIFQMDSSGGLKDISQLGMKNWFKENLPFKISKYFSGVNIDNSFTGIGLTSTWDNKYDRFILTKKDYVPLDKNIIYDEIDQTFKINDITISLTDRNYFCDASWTVAYSPQTESWISFYSFIPDGYIEQTGYFQSIKNGSGILHSHPLRDDIDYYQSFYGIIEPFEIHTVTKATLDFNVLLSINYRSEVYKYRTPYERILKKNISFDNACIYNVDQTSGELQLKINDKNDLSSGLFSQTNEDSTIISLAEANQEYRFNQFYNLVKDDNEEPIVLFDCANTVERINPDAIDYSLNNNIRKVRLKSDWFKIKLANNIESKYKFIFKWLIDKSLKSPR